jgi:hypothetical protein
VAKLLGGGLHNSSVVRGMVLKNDAVGSIKRVDKAKVSQNATLHSHCTPVKVLYLSFLLILMFF